MELKNYQVIGKKNIRNNRLIKIEGMEDITTELSVDGRIIWAYIPVNSIEMDAFYNQVKKLKEAGFIYYGTTHELGYYDAVEDITLEFTATVNK